MRCRLRTLLIVLALGPPALAGLWWGYRDWQARRAAALERQAVFQFYIGITR